VTDRRPRRARTPRRHLYRIGRPPDPLAWPPHAVIGQERFDDPLRQYRVLYAATPRAGCFAETLAAFRPSLASLAAERAVLNATEPPRSAYVPATWWRNRLVGTFTLGGGRWLDLRALATFHVLRDAFAELAHSLGLADVDLSAATGRIAIAGDDSRLPRRSRAGRTSVTIKESSTPAASIIGSRVGRYSSRPPFSL
jgi:hypothetical protein